MISSVVPCRQKMKEKTHIVNPSTGRCVLISGPVGKALLLNKKSKFEEDINGPNEIKFKYHCVKRQGMMQNMGTCWFNSIFNAFLMSEKLYSHFLNQYRELSLKKKEIIENAEFFDTCPLTLKRDHFLRYFFILSKNLEYNYSQLRYKLDNFGAFGAKLLINDLGIRSPDWQRTSRQGYDIRGSMKKILPILFDESEYRVQDFQRKITFTEKPQFIVMTNYHPIINRISYFEHMGSDYDLECAIIEITTKDKSGQKNGGHGICGYICGNVRYIYDSNKESNVRLDWSNIYNIYKHYKGKLSSGIIYHIELSYIFYVMEKK